MSQDLLNEFKFPQAALINGAAEFLSRGVTARAVQSGGGGTVNDYEMAGHDRGISFRFFIALSPNQVKSEHFDMEINDEIPMIEWFVSKKHKPTERVHMIGDQLLKFAKEPAINGDGRRYMKLRIPLECTGGKFKEAFIAWQQGVKSPGLSLSRWNELSMSQVATLNSIGVFSVQQFAAMPRDRVEGRMPNEFIELFNKAIQFVNAQKPMVEIEQYAAQVVALKQENAKREQEMAAMRAQLAALEASNAEKKNTEPKKKKGMPKGGWPKKDKEPVTNADTIQP